MINDLSLLLRKILNNPSAPNPLRSAQIAFDRPTDPYNPGQATVNLFLYDIHENVDLRTNVPIIEKNNGQAIIHRPPIRIACSYMVTAWPDQLVGEALVLQEQLLLSQALQVLSGFPIIPDFFLLGTNLQGQEPLLPMITAQSDGMKSSSEFWASLGNKIRPSFTVTVTLSLPVFEPDTAFLVKTLVANLGVSDQPPDESFIQIGGRVLRSPGDGIATATVDITDAGLRAMTDVDGRFTFSRVPAGTRTFRVVAVGFEPKTQSIVVPGRPEDYEITLIPL
jgi:Pvc16 N-terminal domain/Carboxypeptidase regulatory-like domain